MSRKLDEPEWGRWSPTWRTHSCVPRRDSSRRPVRAHDSYTVSKSRCRDETRHGTQECVRHVGDQPYPPWPLQLPPRFGKAGDIRRSEDVLIRHDTQHCPDTVVAL